MEELQQSGGLLAIGSPLEVIQQWNSKKRFWG